MTKHKAVNFGATLYFLLVISAQSVPAQSAPSGSSVVFPKLLEERRDDGRKILQIQDGLRVVLTKSSVFPEQFLYKEYENGYEIQHHLEGRELEKNLYHDSESMASLIVSTENGLRVEGIVGSKLRIRPLDVEERSSQDEGGHLLYEVEERIPQPDDIMHAEGRDLFGDASAFAHSFHAQSRRDNTDMPRVYPELLILVDTAHHKKFVKQKKKRSEAVIDYFAIFINAVNLKFATIHYLKVKILLAGVWKHNEDEEKKYMKFHTPNEVVSTDTLAKLGEYAYTKKDDYKSFDLVVVVTGRDLVTVYSNGARSGAESGRAYVGKVCDERRKVGIAEDFPRTFDGVHTFAHETGHIMGCFHDGEEPPANIPHHPGSRNCSPSENLMMSPVSTTSNVHKFSYCCSQQVWFIYNLNTTRCLKEKSRTKYYRAKELPGDALESPDQFCKFEYPEHNETARNVANFSSGWSLKECKLVCQLKPDDYKYYRYDAPDGVRCEEDKVCVNKECTNRPHIDVSTE